jgi:hypothetical protein
MLQMHASICSSSACEDSTRAAVDDDDERFNLKHELEVSSLEVASSSSRLPIATFLAMMKVKEASGNNTH